MTKTSELRVLWAPPCSGPWAKISLNGQGKVSVRPAITEAVKALNSSLIAFNYVTRAHDTGAFNCRPIASSGLPSLHSYGIALDINWQTNPFQRKLKTDMPREMVNAILAIRTNNGRQVWGWGGNYSGNKDAMHYEIVCSPRDLATGINWSTVKGRETPDPGPASPVIPQPDPNVANLIAIAKGIAEAKKKVLRQGDKGDAVKWLQAGINKLSGANLAVDGDFGGRTTEAVKNLQRWFHLVVDGIVGPRTWEILFPS